MIPLSQNNLAEIAVCLAHDAYALVGRGWGITYATAHQVVDVFIAWNCQFSIINCQLTDARIYKAFDLERRADDLLLPVARLIL